jgi:hypothetical protein
MFHGTIVHTPLLGEIEILEDHVLTVANDGLIESVEPACDAIEKLATQLVPAAVWTLSLRGNF